MMIMMGGMNMKVKMALPSCTSPWSLFQWDSIHSIGKRGRWGGFLVLSTLAIVVSVVVNIIVVPIRMMAWPRLYGRQGGDQPDIGPFIALLLAFLLFCFLFLMTLAKKKMQLLNAVTAHKIGSFFFLCLLSFTFLNVLDSVGNTLLASWTSLMTVSAHSMHLLANLSLHPPSFLSSCCS